MDVITQAQRDKRTQEFINDHARKSKATNDHHFRKAVALGAPADFAEADYGEPPHGARW